MKRLFFAVVAMLFAACTTDVTEDVTVKLPETITVSFEEGSRIQLNEGKTVWTAGDLVSVFYRSDANQQWKYDGETGARTAELKRVDAGTATRDMDRVVVVYPYNKDYYINLETYNVQASLPAVQNYLKDSYGTNGNIMISSSEYNQFSLKSVCGWLKLQLTGDGETIKSIKFRGNDGEQVAGELYINSTDATAALASDMGNADDNNAGGSLVFDDTILTEVTLDCGEGVELLPVVTSFYIAIPPQTFEKGFTVEIEDTEGYVMEQSTDKALTIERNHIQPMASFTFVNPNNKGEPKPANNEIWYTNGSTTEPTAPNKPTAFGNATIQSNTYDAEKEYWVITFDKDVTEIGDYAFRNCKSLTSVTIPDSVTTIGSSAFYYCKSLTSVTIPDSVTTIGSSAFCYCTSLTSVTIPDSVTTIGGWAFNNCISLTSVTIPDSVTTIGNGAFSLCESLTSATIPDSVTTIGNGAFSGCDSLKEFKGKFAADNGRCLIKDNTIIAYAEASGTTYTIPDSVTTIEGWAFNKCISLTSVTIPDSVTTIGYEAFRDCTSLTSVTIPDSVTTIGDYAFYDCDSLTSVTIGNSVTTIGDAAFDSCASLTSVTIGNSVTTIGVAAFSWCFSLTSVTIPDSVTTIGSSAFYHCESLTSVTIPDSVTTIGDSAFYYCKSLTSVTIPDSVTTIGDSAFYYCKSLKTVYCKPTTPPAGGDNMFYDNASGRKIYVPAGSVEAYKSAEYWNAYADYIEEYDFTE